MKIIENNKKVKIDQVQPNTYNPKPDFNSTDELKVEFGKIKESLRIHGQIDPVLVREIETDKYELINGYHRWMAMKELKFTEVEIKNLGIMSKEDAIKKALSTEELRVPLDVIEVAKLIKQVADSEAGLEGLPYLQEEIEKKIALLEFDWDNFQDTGETDELPDVKTFKIIVTTEQRTIIMQAMEKIKTAQGGIKDGRAMELICADFLAGH